MTIHLTVYGAAQPQGSKSGFSARGSTRVAMREGGSKAARDRHKDWRQAVATAGRAWQDSTPTPLLDEPLAVSIVFHLPRPKSSRRWWLWCRSRPDLDKLVRAVFDGLTGVIWTDDSRVVELRARKPYGDPPRAEVTITPLGTAEREGRLTADRPTDDFCSVCESGTGAPCFMCEFAPGKERT